MGQENFYVYDGRIQVLPCSVREYVFDDLNTQQSFKFHAGSLSSQTEIWWYYCSADSSEIDRYVVYNYGQQVWYYGTLTRTAWNDRASGQRSFPQSASTDRFLYNHEKGLDDGSQSPSTAVPAYIQSADFDIGDGDQFMLIRRIIPDLSFTGSSDSTPAVSRTMQSRDFNGKAVTETVTGTVEESSSDVYTNQVFLRARGRSMNFKVSNADTGVNWRLGAPRLDVQADGRR